MAQFQAYPPAGQPLPKDWKRNAPAIGAAADRAYMERLQNAWRGNGNPDPNVARSCRLTSTEPGPTWQELQQRSRLSSNDPSWSDLLGNK